MSTQNLLVELFVEELPPKALKKLDEAFANGLVAGLKNQKLVADNTVITHFATPRRLAVHLTNVNTQAEDEAVALKLMPAKVGLDADGKPTPALLKRLQGMGEDESAVAKLRKEVDGKNEVLFLDTIKQGASLQAGLQQALEETINKLPIPKVMTYQLQKDTPNPGWDSVNFVRPAHGLVALHGSDVVDISILGLSAGNTTKGHRFEATVDTIALKHADEYEAKLLDEGSVIASYDKRKADIAQQIKAAADKEGLVATNDPELLDEVTALVELPNVLVGQYENEFLEVPQECLILTMKANQKYFPLLDADGKLSNKFLITSNIKPDDPSAVIGGNERVVRPRLADAKFFFEQDRKKTLESRLEGLNKVVYHNKLGSQGERSARVVGIATSIAEAIDSKLVPAATQAARLSKADLITDMVGEFPKLQGIMGRYYAQAEGLDDTVAYAIEDHYKPGFAGDTLPRSQAGICVALADKLETLVGLFSIGEKPTGDKDPYALRRQAVGILRMLIEAKLPFTFDQLILDALSQFETGDDTNKIAAAIKAFCFDRLSVNLRENGSSPQEVDAVLSNDPAQLSEIPERLAAVQAFAQLPEAEALAAANKRVANILKKIEGDIQAQVNESLLAEDAEKALFKALNATKPEADKRFEAGDYTGSLQALAALKAPVDDFFDKVMVNAEDPALKANRQGMLAILHQTMNRVADLSKLAS
jgi:glycyl-tRNA synthetase beta chain